MLLTSMIFIPLVGMIVVLLVPRDREDAAKWIAFMVTLIPLFLAVLLYFQYDPTSAELQERVETSWIEAFNIKYHTGVDGLSVTLILLTAL
ncbi:TPA: NADH-quinone oxidoreductase subunit M, partial [Candidatus Poribacteria bacterium]|nr:NADH-quinone oxidoreductase subunit M [Candidatus Poribacteria bacterium]